MLPLPFCDNKPTKGIAAIFQNEDQVVKAVEIMRDKKFQKFDAYTPYPIHGLDDAMGLKPSYVPYFTLLGGLAGTFTAVSMMTYMSVIDWPMNVGGKPLVSLPAWIPIMFELTVLLAGLTTAAVMFFAAKIPKISRKPFDLRITDDRFAVYVPDCEKGYNEAELRKIFQELGAEDVKHVAGVC